MWSSIVIFEDNFVVFFLVLWPFLLQFLVQTHKLRSIPIPCDGFTRFQQLIIQRTELGPPNADYNIDMSSVVALVTAGRVRPWSVWCNVLAGYFRGVLFFLVFRFSDAFASGSVSVSRGCFP